VAVAVGGVMDKVDVNREILPMQRRLEGSAPV
jgi:hypothetical protein